MLYSLVCDCGLSMHSVHSWIMHVGLSTNIMMPRTGASHSRCSTGLSEIRVRFQYPNSFEKKATAICQDRHSPQAPSKADMFAPYLASVSQVAGSTLQNESLAAMVNMDGFAFILRYAVSMLVVSRAPHARLEGRTRGRRDNGSIICLKKKADIA